MVKKLTTVLFISTAIVSAIAFSHPGHDGLSSAVHPDKHILSGTESIVIYTSIALLAAAVFWFAKRR